MKYFKHLSVLIAALIIVNACKKDNAVDETNVAISVTLNFTKPTNIEIAKLTDAKVILTELNTQAKKEFQLTDTYTLQAIIPRGSYEISVGGKIQYLLDGNTIDGELTAFVNKIDLLIAETHNIPLVLKAFSKDLLIEEVFFAGTLSPEDKQYFGDQYIKLYNNTDQVIYADGLLIADSRFLTTQKQDVTPNIMSEAFTAEGIIQIPGNGQQYPVQPRQAIIIADQGINHTEINKNSIDLSQANFEIFYTGMKDGVDNPTVTNVINFDGRMIFHNRGFRSYVIARLPKDIDNDTFLKNYKYEYEFPTAVRIMKRDAYKLPNAWIVDAVNLSVASEFVWTVTDPSLDSGWTFCGKVDRDKTRYGKSVRRKVLQDNNGQRLLKDTNNSTVDFDAEAKPSLFP